MSGTEHEVKVVSADVAFLRELLQRAEEGKVRDVMCIVTGPSGKSVVAGPGLDQQMRALEMHIGVTPEGLARARSALPQPSILQTIGVMRAKEH